MKAKQGGHVPSLVGLVIVSGAALLAACGESRKPAAAPTPTTTSVSTQPAGAAKAALFVQCAGALEHYQAVGRDLGTIAAAPSNSAAYGPAVADLATLKTDLTVLKPSGTPPQQAQIDQYTTVLSQLSMSFQTAAGGDYAAATGQLTGVAQQIGQIPALVSQICPT